MMFADDAFSNLVALFCKACQLHAAGVAPNKYGRPKCIEWQWKLLSQLDVACRKFLLAVVGPPSNIDWSVTLEHGMKLWSHRSLAS